MTDDRAEIIYKNCFLCCGEKNNLAVYDDEKTRLHIIDDNGQMLFSLTNVNTDSCDIYDEYIYYSNKDDENKIYRASFDGMENEKVCDYSTEKVEADNNIIYFESDNKSDNNSIYSLSLENGVCNEVYSGIYCFFFKVYNNLIFLSDYSTNNNIIAINSLTGEIEKEFDIRSLVFCINESKLFYIPAVSEDIVDWNNFDLHMDIYSAEI